MNRTEFISSQFFSSTEKQRIRQFLIKAFLVYALVEGVYLVINFLVTRNLCVNCTNGTSYYLIICLSSFVFTGLLWYLLDRCYHYPIWAVLLINILLFLSHYFSWIGILHALRSSGEGWLLGRNIKVPSYKDLIYASWFDIGKYVLKVSAFYALRFYVDYRQSARQRTELAVLNKDLQLNLLKQQLSPHFYFNTLNNLYGLARSNSSKLPEALLQLSNIMEYVIVECNKPKVLLRQEINFLKSYIALEKLRYESNTVIEMKVTGDPDGQVILPLLLIQFVENAFKHGMKEKSEQNWLKVNVAIEKENLIFSVLNSYYESGASKGIGIESVLHQLNLQYETKYEMEMQNENNRFSVILKLNLS